MENRALSIMLPALLLFFLMCTSILAEENIPYHPKPCVDCHGKPVSAEQYYYDGCNVCYCYEENTAECTEKSCKWNKCYPVEKEQEKEGEENEKEEENHKTYHQRTSYLWWK